MIVIVAGFGRSGTSLMMRMLRESGFPAFYDRFLELSLQARNRDYRVNDEFLECPGSDTMRIGFPREIPPGSAVKLPVMALPMLPANCHEYRVIYMQRDPAEIRESFERSMPDVKNVTHSEEWPRIYERRLFETKAILDIRSDSEWVEVEFRDLIEAPYAVAERVSALGVTLSDAALGLIDPSLYRHRSAA